MVAEAAEKRGRGTLRGTDRRGGDVAGDADGKAAGVARRRGRELPDAARATVEEALLERDTTGGFPTTSTRYLQIRLRAARASTRKLVRMMEMTGAGGSRCAASSSSVGPAAPAGGRGGACRFKTCRAFLKGFSPDLFTDMARQAVWRDPWDTRRVAPAPVLDCVSWSLRSCLKATDDDKVLWSFDFSQIEARVLAWLAGQRDVLAVFASGEDVYVWAASAVRIRDRQLGKVLILALGFGMGAVKLRDTALKSYGVELTAAQAETFKDGWRASNGKIVTVLVTSMEIAAKQAILQQGRVYAVGGLRGGVHQHGPDPADAAAVGAGALLSPATARSGDRQRSSIGGPRSAAAGSNNGHGAASWPRTPRRRRRATSWRKRCCGRGGGTGWCRA